MSTPIRWVGGAGGGWLAGELLVPAAPGLAACGTRHEGLQGVRLAAPCILLLRLGRNASACCNRWLCLRTFLRSSAGGCRARAAAPLSWVSR